MKGKNDRGKGEGKAGFRSFIHYFTNILTLNISLIVRGKAIMKDPNGDSTLTFAVRSLKLFSPFWVKFIFRRS